MTHALILVLAATLRLDYYHTGNAGQELFSVDRVVIEPLPWPGHPAHPIDDSDHGVYLFEVHDAASHELLYSRGFQSIFGEWTTTDEAKHANRTFHESLRFPAPSAPVEIVVKRRDRRNVFVDVWTTAVDPADKRIERATARAPAPVIAIQKSGDPAGKVDLLLLGEGYAAGELAACRRDVRRLSDALFTYSPFKERRRDFNVWAMCAPSPESGVSHPQHGVHRRTLFDSQFDVFGEDRYALAFDNRALRDMAQYAPYDFLGIVMNSGDYGNGGILGLYATVSIHHPQAIGTFVHEFGHHFAGLGDEYYFNADVAYAPAATQVEPWEPNVTAVTDREHLKWKDLVAADTPVPTPWPKERYEAAVVETQKRVRELEAAHRPAAEIAEIRRRSREEQRQLLASGPYSDRVGAFQGAMYENGYYRPQQRCIMIVGPEFCAVCRRAIEAVIDAYSRP